MTSKIQKKAYFLFELYHKIKENMPFGEELEKMWNYPLYEVRNIVKLFSGAQYKIFFI